jgi:hypothetical protein
MQRLIVMSWLSWAGGSVGVMKLSGSRGRRERDGGERYGRLRTCRGKAFSSPWTFARPLRPNALAGRSGDVPSPQYDPAMCRSESHGSGRRCPGCGSYKAAAKANGKRRLAREARRTVVEHLKEQGLVESAAAVLAAPPSVLKEFMEELGIDPEVLGKTPLPSTHTNPPSAKLLIAQARPSGTSSRHRRSPRLRLLSTQPKRTLPRPITTRTKRESLSTATATATGPGSAKRRRSWKQEQVPPKLSPSSRNCSRRPRTRTSMPNGVKPNHAMTLPPRSSACGRT